MADLDVFTSYSSFSLQDEVLATRTDASASANPLTALPTESMLSSPFQFDGMGVATDAERMISFHESFMADASIVPTTSLQEFQPTQEGELDVLLGQPLTLSFDAATSLDTPASDEKEKGLEVLKLALPIASRQLSEFVDSPDYLKGMQNAFGQTDISESGRKLINELVETEFASFSIRVLTDLPGQGAFDESSETIYLSQDFLLNTETSPDSVAKVIIEAVGHYLDSTLNQQDTPGDEGAIFARVVLAGDINLETRDALRRVDDQEIVRIGGEEIPVEFARAANVINGTSGNDNLVGGGNDDQIFGKGGNDTLSGRGGNDLLDGGSGRDNLDGGTGEDRLFGGSGNDTLRGGAGSDRLWGDLGADTLNGETGSDILRGGGNSDVYSNPR